MLAFFITTTVVLLIPYLVLIAFLIRQKQKFKRIEVSPMGEGVNDQENSFEDFFKHQIQYETNHSSQERQG